LIKEEAFLASFFSIWLLEEDMFVEESQLESDPQDLRLKMLTEAQAEQIDELLRSLGDQGEVHLIVQRGILKYINRVQKNAFWGTNGQE
jgi:hypothetical protein